MLGDRAGVRPALAGVIEEGPQPSTWQQLQNSGTVRRRVPPLSRTAYPDGSARAPQSRDSGPPHGA